MLNMNPINIDKVKQIVDALVTERLTDEIFGVMQSGFGEVNCKVTIQNGAVKVISISDTKTVKIE